MPMRLTGGVLGVLLSLVGCAANREIEVKSEPPAATVMRADQVLGVTPFKTDINMLFPHREHDFKFGSSTALIFKKEGFEDGTVTVSEYSAPPVIQITLVRKNLPTSPPSPKPPLEDRLRELENLRQRGVITEDEYQRKREELLKEL